MTFSEDDTVASHDPELIAELDATIFLLGRLFASRHGETHGECVPAHQMFALRVLEERGATKVSEIAHILGVKAPAASAMIDQLDKAGYIDRGSDPHDRRVSLITVSESGRAVLLHTEAERRVHMSRYTSILSEQDVRDLIRINRTLIEAMVDETI